MKTKFLKKITGLISLLIVIHTLNCATYWNNRRKDAQDIFTLGIEYPTYGLGFRGGPLASGFMFQGGKSKTGEKNKGKGFGLRGGRFGKYHTQQLVIGFLGGESFYSYKSFPKNEKGKYEIPYEETEDGHIVLPELYDERDSAKSYNMRYLSFYNIPVEERKRKKRDAVRKQILEEYLKNSDATDAQKKMASEYLEENFDKKKYPKSFLFQTELFFGLWLGLRVGFNIAELLDFALGFFGADILKDDI